MLDVGPHRKLGESNLLVSPLGLGTVKFGRNTGVKYPVGFELPGDQQLIELLQRAWDMGINFLDTAPAYGSSEQRLGNLTRLVKRDWVVTTKVGEFFEGGASHYDFSKSAIERSIESSLRNLQTEQLSLVFVHSDGNDEQVIRQSDVLDILGRRKDKGDIGAIGFSGKTVAGSLLAIDLVDVFMVTLNEADQSQADLIRACSEHNKGVVIKKALQSGHAKTADEALRFAVNYPGTHSVIVGTINLDHLEQNVRAIAKNNC